MTYAAKRQQLEADLAQAQQQVAIWTEKAVGTKYQLALLAELEAADAPQEPNATPVA